MGLTLDYAFRPLTLGVVDADGQYTATHVVIAHQLLGHLDVAGSLCSCLTLSASLPVALLERRGGSVPVYGYMTSGLDGGPAGTNGIATEQGTINGVPALDPGIPSDPRLGIMVYVYGRPDEDPFSVSLGGNLWLPGRKRRSRGAYHGEQGDVMFREPARSDHPGVGGAAARHEGTSPGKRTLTSELASQPLVDGPTEVVARSAAVAPRGSGPGLAGLFGRPGASATPISDREPDEPRSTQVTSATTEGPAPQQATTQGAPSGPETPRPGTSTPGAVSDAPTASYIVPFDRSPLAAPGERIICRAEFTGGTASEYEIVYTTTGGHFTTASGPTTLTIQGLRAGNVNFFVPTPWNGTDAVSITMQLKKKSDSSVVQTETWNFGKKAYYPTTMTQREGTGEVDLPGRYTYDIGPARPSGTAPFYEHQTILEWFDNWSISNIAPEDIREAYRTAHGLTSTAAITAHFIGTYAGDNGTFTVNPNDRVGDRHNGHPDAENLASNLTAPKDIEVALPQTYEAQPGTALARFMVTRVRKTDGAWKVKKAPR